MITIESLYEDLKREVNAERLKEISAGIITHYRNKNLSALMTYPPAKQTGRVSKNTGALFANLIQSYHPDKLAHILKSIEAAYSSRNLDALLLLKETYIFETGTVAAEELPFSDGRRESYGYDEGEFGYREKNSRDADDEDDEYDGGVYERDAFDDEGSFTAAVNRAFFGGLDTALTAHDLSNLEGELELGDFDIRDLRGVEYCVNIKLLDLSCNRIERIGRLAELYLLEKLFLSDNRIEDISALRGLDSLVEIDLSFNMIESIDVLVGLRNLQYVNVMGNPLQNLRAISQLAARGVVVVHDSIFAPAVNKRRGDHNEN